MTRALPLLLLLAACQSDDAATGTPAAPADVRPETAALSEPAADSEALVDEAAGYRLALAPALEPQPSDAPGLHRYATADGSVALTVVSFEADGVEAVFARAREGIDRVTYRDTPPSGGVAVSGTADDATVYARGLYRDGVGVVARVRYLSGNAAGAALSDRVSQTLRWTE